MAGRSGGVQLDQPGNSRAASPERASSFLTRVAAEGANGRVQLLPHPQRGGPRVWLVRSSNVAWARRGAYWSSKRLASGFPVQSLASIAFRAAVSEVTSGLSQRCGAHPGGRGSGPPSSTSQVPAQSVLPVLGGAIFLWETDDVPCSQQAGPYARSKARVHAHQNEIRLSCVPPLRASPEAVLSEQAFTPEGGLMTSTVAALMRVRA